MKRLYTLIALLCLTIGVLTGCTPSDNNPPPAGTNAAPPAPSTNK